MAQKLTRADFIEAMEQDEACYIYYTDSNGYMHFLCDNPSESDEENFCAHIADALLCSNKYARKLKFLCDFLFDNRVHHIVRMHTRVEWL